MPRVIPRVACRQRLAPVLWCEPEKAVTGVTAAPSGAPVDALPGAGATEWGGLFITHRSVPALYHAMHVCYLLTTNGPVPACGDRPTV